MWSVKSRTTREPLDRRQVRLVQALLAFPAAGIIGFAGNAVVKNVLRDSTSVTSPATPARATDKPAAPKDGDERDEPSSDNSKTVRLV